MQGAEEKRLNRMECTRYLVSTPPDSLGTPELTVTLGGEKPVSLQIYPEGSGVTDDVAGRPAGPDDSCRYRKGHRSHA